MSSTWRHLQLHVEARVDGAWTHVAHRTISGRLTELMGIVDATKRKSVAAALDVVPPDASARTREHVADLERVRGVSVMTASDLARVAWGKGPEREGLVDGKQYANILAGRAVTEWSKGALGVDIIDNDAMAAHVAAGTATFRMLTRATWIERLEHRASTLHELYLEHVRDHDDRRVLAVWS